MQDQNEILSLLDEWEQVTLKLEEEPSLNAVHQAFQTVHSLKGLLSLLGFHRASKAVHEKGELLDEARRTNDFSKLNPDAVLAFIDALRQRISQGRDWETQKDTSQPQQKSVHSYEWKKPLSQETLRLINQDEAQGKKLWVLQKSFSTKLNPDQWTKLPIFKTIAEVGFLYDYDPPPQEWDRHNDSTVLVSFLFGSAKDHQELTRVFYDPVLPSIVPKTMLESSQNPQQNSSFPLKILILEDDNLTLMLLTQILAQTYQVVGLQAGNDAWREWLRASQAGQPYNVIILDLMVPDLSGLELLKRIRDWEHTNNVAPKHRARIFINSALDDNQSVTLASNYQADGYFFKPFSIDKILSTLDHIKSSF